MLEGEHTVLPCRVALIEEVGQLVCKFDQFGIAPITLHLAGEDTKPVEVARARDTSQAHGHPGGDETTDDERDDVHGDLLVDFATLAEAERPDDLVGDIAR